MPSEMYWYIKGRVVYVREYGDVRLEDVYAANETARGFLNNSATPLFFLIDRVKLETAPKSLSGIISVLDTLKHQNFGWAMVFGQAGNRYARALTHFLVRYFGINLREFDSLEEALMFLIEIDAELEQLIQEKTGQATQKHGVQR